MGNGVSVDSDPHGSGRRLSENRERRSAPETAAGPMDPGGAETARKEVSSMSSRKDESRTSKEAEKSVETVDPARKEPENEEKQNMPSPENKGGGGDPSRREGDAPGKRVGSGEDGKDDRAAGRKKDSPGTKSREGEKELGEDEVRRLLEESLEKVTVAEIVLSIMNQVASIAYLKLGLPENVNLKYRSLEQARLAIDVLDAMLKAAEGKIPSDKTSPFKGTLANLQLNFVQVAKKTSSGK